MSSTSTAVGETYSDQEFTRAETSPVGALDVVEIELPAGGPALGTNDLAARAAFVVLAPDALIGIGTDLGAIADVLGAQRAPPGGGPIGPAIEESHRLDVGAARTPVPDQIIQPGVGLTPRALDRHAPGPPVDPRRVMIEVDQLDVLPVGEIATDSPEAFRDLISH